MTNDPRAQSEPAHELPPSVRDAVVYLAAASYDAGKHGATDSSSVRDASNELGFAIASALIMNSECWKQMVTNTRAVTEVLQIDLATCRAENAALAKLADELSVDHRDDDTFDAGVRYALFILGFEKEAVEANDASKALRAGQQKG